MLLTAKVHTANDDARLNPTHSLTHSLTHSCHLCDWLGPWPTCHLAAQPIPCRQYCAATWSMIIKLTQLI